MLTFFFLWISTLLLSSFIVYLLYRRRSAQCPPLPPGPNGWPILGNLPQLGAKPHQTLDALSKQYGPLFRLRLGSVNVVVASSSAVAAQFLRTHDVNFSNRPPNSGAEHVAYNYQDLVFAPYGPRWRMLRKLCSVHLFSLKALDDLRPVRQGEVACLVRNLRRHADTGVLVNLGKALNVCATNALARAMLGRRVFADEDAQLAEADEFKEMVVELMRLAGVFNVGDFVPGLGWLDLQGVVGKMKRLHRRYDAFLDRVIEENQANAKSGDLLSVLIRLKEADAEGEIKLNNTDIKALLLNLFTAGTDTSSSTVEWVLAELIRHPDILQKTQHELDSVIGRDRLVAESDLPNLPYLQAVVKETFRLHPSTPLSLPRMASEECIVNGYKIPKHATLLVNVWSIGRDAAVWNDPLEFRPSRFLPGGEREHVDVKGNDFEVIPFGAGRRICAGLSLGLRMVQFMTATIVHAYDWSLPKGQECQKLDMEEAYGLTLQRAVPLMVQPIPRLSHKAY
uniref:Flavonoid 3'-monooxygenase CYP75B137 n=1 Tax=Crocosmia x crocosmiiflora TaxID=1053288 RepID=CYP1_CROXC|nr:RecName: Full=Flavonoid 3'-monooxygenase CYP75B137; AltName: Full=Cytochrome P450 1; Short=CcCYP1; AltName: Full=Cytochrome P450 75B137; AltName: Full=Flavonoid 3'-hydroxylase CYP75B137 [Crocosmia x crocosmiiflora]QCF41215.1 flavonoid 3'-hydroxylase [Crocosmia x crocosmiiflora]